MRHVELLMHREINRLEVRRGQAVPPDIAEGSCGSFDERGRVEPSGRSGVLRVSVAYQRGNRAIVAGVGARTGVVHADDDVLRNAALNRRTRARLPATGQGVDDRIVDVQALAFAYRKVIRTAEHEPMACVERRQRPLTPRTPAVLRKQRVEALHADAAAVVNGLGERVRTGHAQALAEAPRDPQAAGVVDGVETVSDQLDYTEGGIRQTRAHIAGRAWNGLVGVEKTVEVMALRPEVAGLHRPVRPELPLNVQQVLHGVRRGVVVSGHVGVRRRYLENGPISARDGIVPNQARISNIRCERYSSPSIACQVEVHGVCDVLCVENTPAATDHGPVIERVRNAD